MKTQGCCAEDYEAVIDVEGNVLICLGRPEDNVHGKLSQRAAAELACDVLQMLRDRRAENKTMMIEEEPDECHCCHEGTPCKCCPVHRGVRT